MTVTPARPQRPKNKAKVETGVLVVERFDAGGDVLTELLLLRKSPERDDLLGEDAEQALDLVAITSHA